MATEFEWHWKEGDHRFVTIPTALTNVTFNMNSSNTSSNDTETNKYFDNVSRNVTQFSLVADQDVQLTKVNSVTLTDAISVNGNAEYAEKEGNYNSVTVKTTADNTQISLRVR